VAVFGHVLQRLGVEPGERSLFLWAGSCLALIGAAALGLLNTAETLFLKRVGVESLPLVLLASSGLLVLTTGLASRALSDADRPRWLPRVLLILAAAVAPFWLLADIDNDLVFYGLVLASRQVLAVGMLTFWVTLADLVTGRQAKRLYAPLTAGITLGMIGGSFGSEPIGRLVGIHGLLLVCAATLACSALAAQRVGRAQPRKLGHGSGAVAHAPRRRRASGPSPREIWRESRLFRLLLVPALCGGLLGPVLYYEFSYLADASTTGPQAEQQLLALYAQFRGWLNIATLFAQLWLSSRLYHRLGIPLAVALWPLTYLVGFVWLGVQLGLRAGVTSLGGARVAEDGIAGPGLRVLFNLFPEDVRSRAASLLEGPLTRVGSVTGNTLVLAALPLGGATVLGWAAVPLAVLWLACMLVLRRAYPGLLLQASADRSLGSDADKAKLLDPGTLRALAPSLADPDPRTCRAAIDLVTDADPGLSVELLADAIARAPEHTRPLLVAALHRTVEPLPPGRLRSPRASETLAHLLGGAGPALPPEERPDLLQAYARLTGGDDAPEEEARRSRLVLERAMGDREAAVRLVAIAELHRRRRPPPGASDLDTALSGALAARDFLVRRTARKEMRAMLLSTEPDASWATRLDILAARLEQRADRAETAQALAALARRHDGATARCAAGVARWLDDRDPVVRGAALAYMGHAGLRECGPRLLEALGSKQGEESEAAREALVALGAETALPLLLESDLETPGQRDAVISVLRELEVDAAQLAPVYARELRAAREAVLLRAALGADHPAGLVRRRLAERADQALGTLICCVAVLRADERIAELERRLRRTRNERRRDLLVEALESLLGTAERRELVPLLEPAGDTAELAESLGLPLPDAEEAWARLLDDADELTRRLARASDAGVEAASRIEDASGVRDPVELAVRLQDVPVFGRLSTQQLVGLAESLREEQLEPGARVYAEGDEGSSLYIVLEGEVELLRGELSLERVGPGRFFGEISTLDGVPRSLSARAAKPTTLLRLEREDLLALMEDAPALGIGLSQHLALRVRELRGAEASP
jgi:CRP/FNR family cyclic AMP-dependent transcriptional regulator